MSRGLWQKRGEVRDLVSYLFQILNLPVQFVSSLLGFFPGFHGNWHLDPWEESGTLWGLLRFSSVVFFSSPPLMTSPYALGRGHPEITEESALKFPRARGPGCFCLSSFPQATLQTTSSAKPCECRGKDAWSSVCRVKVDSLC